MKSENYIMLQMNTLSENIIKSKANIEALDANIRDTESSILTQHNVCEQAVKDNNAKTEFNNMVQGLIQWNPASLCSVMISNDELQQALAPIKALKEKINAQNVSAAEQNTKLETLNSKLRDFNSSRQQEVDLLTSYKLQLKVAIDKQKQELANLEALLNPPAENAVAAQANNQ